MAPIAGDMPDNAVRYVEIMTVDSEKFVLLLQRLVEIARSLLIDIWENLSLRGAMASRS